MESLKSKRALCLSIGLICLIVFLSTGCAFFEEVSEGKQLLTSSKFVSTSINNNNSHNQVNGFSQFTTNHVTVSNQDGDSGTLISPNNVTGKAVALIITTGSNEGVDIFGPKRPDQIQPNDPELILVPFDMSERLRISSTTEIPDDFRGGQSNNMAIVIGYMDIHFGIDSNNFSEGGSSTSDIVVRIALGSIEGMIKGDVLFKLNNEFKWLNSSDQFVSTRPANPVMVPKIRDFNGSEHQPDMHFYSLNIQMNQSVNMDAGTVLTSSAMNVELDFHVDNLLLIKNKNDLSSINEVDLVKAVRLSGSIDNGNSGLSVTPSVTFL
ncbi:hypothetical protein HOH87_08120 [bacterium]|jgi:hypothetical protein|nr:hypothetical protein [bacterium]